MTTFHDERHLFL